MNRVYHFGYSNQDASEHITSLMKDENVLLIDTRLKPYSWRSEWQGNTLKSKYGERYRQAGHCLGNINYQGGDIKIVDLDRGIKGLMMYINQGHDLILLCQCSHNGCHRYVILGALRNEMPQVEIRTMLVDDTCHRSEIVRLLTEQVHVNVVHYQPAEQQAVLAAKSGKQDAETIEASVGDPDGIQNTMSCLSIKQPWAWLIANGFKNIENRDWTTGYRGPLLIHAGKAVDNDCFIGKEINFDFFEQFGDEVVDALPRHKKDYSLGCIIGQANLVSIVEDSDSQWFYGKYGFTLENAQVFDPVPYPGKLKLFNVPKDVISNQSAEQETVLVVETDELLIETAVRPDDDPSATTGHCIVCSKTATLKSPSGRPEGMYCEQHGYCPRCKSSIEEFVKYSHGDFYVCPCVTASAMRIEQKQELKQAKPVTFGF